MDLFMTGWMQENPIVSRISPAIEPVDDMVIFPTRYLGDFLTADGAETIL